MCQFHSSMFWRVLYTPKCAGTFYNPYLKIYFRSILNIWIEYNSQVPVNQIKYCEKYVKFKGKKYKELGYGWNVFMRIVPITIHKRVKSFHYEISTSTETKSWKKKPTIVATISKTDNEQVLRFILRLSLLIQFRVFRVHAHAFS